MFIVGFLNVTKSSFIQATLTHCEKVHLCLNRLYFTAITSFLISIWSIHSAINANCECIHPVPHNTERSVGLISARHEGWRTNRLWLIWVQIVEDKWELVGGWMLGLLRYFISMTGNAHYDVFQCVNGKKRKMKQHFFFFHLKALSKAF